MVSPKLDKSRLIFRCIAIRKKTYDVEKQSVAGKENCAENWLKEL